MPVDEDGISAENSWGPTQFPIQWAPESKMTGRETDNSFPSRAAFMGEWRYTYILHIHPLCLQGQLHLHIYLHLDLLSSPSGTQSLNLRRCQ